MYFRFLYLITADPSLGRINKSTLSQQTLMELLVNEILNRERILLGSVSDPPDALNWKGVKSNEALEITIIDWSYKKLEGSILLPWLPQTVTHLYLWGNRLRGTLDLSALPPVLKVLNIHTNAFEGTVDLSLFPSSVEMILLSHTRLSGTLDFGALKPGIRKLFFNNTNFEGEIDFTKLPDSLEYLDIRSTKLSGTAHSTPGRTIRVDRSNVAIVE